MSNVAELVDLALSRLLAITRVENFDRAWSACALLKEHFRRVGLWHDILSPDETLYLHDYDLAAAVAPMPEMVKQKIDSVWEPHLEALRIRERNKRLEDQKNLSRTQRRSSQNVSPVDWYIPVMSSQEQQDLRRYLHWCGVQYLPQVQDVHLPCPYEPIVRLYERGGDYHLHHGWWKVMGLISFPRPHGDWYRSRPSMLALDDASLDEIDIAKAKLQAREDNRL